VDGGDCRKPDQECKDDFSERCHGEEVSRN
jgi:hypothetical protein